MCEGLIENLMANGRSDVLFGCGIISSWIQAGICHEEIICIYNYLINYEIDTHPYEHNRQLLRLLKKFIDMKI